MNPKLFIIGNIFNCRNHKIFNSDYAFREIEIYNPLKRNKYQVMFINRCDKTGSNIRMVIYNNKRIVVNDENLILFRVNKNNQ